MVALYLWGRSSECRADPVPDSPDVQGASGRRWRGLWQEHYWGCIPTHGHVKSRKINWNHMPEPRHLRKHSSSTLSSHQMSHHPPHPLFLSQVTLQMKLTLIACIVISLFWSLPKDNDPRWGLERRLTSKSKGLPLCSDCPDVWRFVSLSL